MMVGQLEISMDINIIINNSGPNHNYPVPGILSVFSKESTNLSISNGGLLLDSWVWTLENEVSNTA